MTDFDPTDTGPHPDAELLAMGAELDGIAADWHRQRALDAQPDGPSSDGAWDDILGRVYAFADRVMAFPGRLRGAGPCRLARGARSLRSAGRRARTDVHRVRLPVRGRDAGPA